MAKFEYREAKTPRTRGKMLSHLELKKDPDGYTVKHVYQEDGYTHYEPYERKFAKDEGPELAAHLEKHGYEVWTNWMTEKPAESGEE